MTEDKTDSSKRLQKALSGVSTSEMRAVRTQVNQEINVVKGPSSRPPATMASAPVPQTAGDLDDLEKAGKIADNFMVGLDHMADVLMLLVMKFGRASTMVRAVFVGLMIGNVLLTLNLIFSWHLSNVQEAFQEEQVKIQEQQAHMQRSTERVAGEAKVIATAAEKTATEVKDSAPSVVVDAKGRPQLILKVQGSEGEVTKMVDPKRSTLKKDGNLQTPVTF